MEINLLKYNRHWEKGYVYPYQKTRNLFTDIINSLNNKFIVELIGLRRVGKSTLLYQTINYLIKEKKVDPYKIIYFTFDEKQPSIEDLLNFFSTQTQIDFKKEKILVFLDEVQKLSNFQNQIKIYYDLYPNIKFFISGSTSLFIKKKTQESLAGRIVSYLLKPLSFLEYLNFKDKTELLDKPLLYKKDLENEFNNFLNSQFIESIYLSKIQERKEYFRSIVKKIIYEDLPGVFSFDNPQILFSIVEYLAQYPGAVINFINLSRDLKISNKTLSLYFSYLEDSFLIKKLYNFSRNLISSEKKLKKYYLASPSFSFSLVDFVSNGNLFENYFASQTSSSYFWRDVYKNEVDFIAVDKQKNIVPMEVKYKTEINSTDIKNLLLFMKKYQVRKGEVYYLGAEKKLVQRDGKIINLIFSK